MSIRTGAMRSSSMLALTWLAATSNAFAHTDSLGFIITPGSSDGFYNAEIFYGSWHNSVGQAEGALDLFDSGSNLVGTNPFTLVPGFNGVSDGTLPTGLVPGVNYFFPDGSGGLTGDSSGHYIYAFQSTTFNDLSEGSYTFGYNAGSSFTADWQPSDSAINAGAFTIGEGGSLVVVGASGGAIDNSQSSFTSDTFSGGNDATFDGGTLQVDPSATSLSNNFAVNSSGGTIDTNLEDSDFTGDFTGDGIITVVGNGAAHFTGTNTHGGFLVNHASISADSDSALGTTGAALTLNHGTFTPTADMTLARDVVITGSHGSHFNVDDGLSLSLTGAVSGSACLIKTGAGTLSLNAAGANAIGACVEEGLLEFNNTFTGNVWVDPTGLMSGGGTVNGNVEVSGHISPGNSPGVMTIAGDVTLLDGSTFDVDVDGPTPGTGAGFHDQLVLTSGGVFTANGTLAPITRGITGSANNDYTPEIGDQFVIVDADGGVTGSFDSITQPGTGLPTNARWDVLYTSDSVILVVTADQFLALSTLALGNARRIAAAMDVVRPAPASGTGAAGAFFDGLSGLDEAQLALVLQQAAGGIHAQALAATQRASRATRAAVFERLAHAEPSRHFWAQTLGGRSLIDGDDESAGFDSRSGGLVVGADAPVTPRLVLGAALAFLETDVHGDGDAQAQSYGAMGYARWSEGAYFVNGVLSIGVDGYDINREVSLSSGTQELQASVDGVNVALDIEAGRRFEIGAHRIDAVFGLAADQFSRDRVTEQGDASVALAFGAEQNAALRSRLGARYSTAYQVAGVNLRPHAEGFWTHQFDGAVVGMNPTLHGGAFEVRSPDSGPDSFDLGAGVTAQVSPGAEVYLSYAGVYGEDQIDHGVQLGLRMAW